MNNFHEHRDYCIDCGLLKLPSELTKHFGRCAACDAEWLQAAEETAAEEEEKQRGEQ